MLYKPINDVIKHSGKEIKLITTLYCKVTEYTFLIWCTFWTKYFLLEKQKILTLMRAVFVTEVSGH